MPRRSPRPSSQALATSHKSAAGVDPAFAQHPDQPKEGGHAERVVPDAGSMYPAGLARRFVRRVGCEDRIQVRGDHQRIGTDRAGEAGIDVVHGVHRDIAAVAPWRRVFARTPRVLSPGTWAQGFAGFGQRDRGCGCRRLVILQQEATDEGAYTSLTRSFMTFSRASARPGATPNA